MIRWTGKLWKTGFQLFCLVDDTCTSSCSQSAVTTRIWAIIKGEISLSSFLPIKAAELCRKELKVVQESGSNILGFRSVSVQCCCSAKGMVWGCLSPARRGASLFGCDNMSAVCLDCQDQRVPMHAKVVPRQHYYQCLMHLDSSHYLQ